MYCIVRRAIVTNFEVVYSWTEFSNDGWGLVP